MESRRNIYYRGNTVIAPHPSRRNLEKRHKGNQLKKVTIATELKPTTVEEKVCATTQCVWCANTFEREAIRCRVCGNCQYCGRFCTSANYCTQCGNQLPPELRVDKPHRVVRFQPNSGIIQNIREKRKHANQ